MQLVEEEFKRFISSHQGNRLKSGGPSQEVVRHGGSRLTPNECRSSSESSSEGEESEEGEETDDSKADDQALKECGELNQINQLRVFWGKRQWSSRFDMYQKYDGHVNLPLSWWNRLLSWIWSSLAPEHMTAMHNVLYRLRTNRNMVSNIHLERNSGRIRPALQEKVVRDYHIVLRACTDQDVGNIIHRFHLADLFQSHAAYVQHFHDTRRLAWQTARHEVNRILVKVFTEELHTPVSVQKIQNQVKEGRHWGELLSSPATRQVGAGLLLLLPVTGFGDIVRKTADPVWSFVLNNLPNLCPRMLELARVLNPLSQAIRTEGIGLVTCPLLGYELRSPTNIHNLNRNELDACFKTYENLRITDALQAIQSHGRVENPEKIPELVRQEWERKNQRDGIAFLGRADAIERSAQREIQCLRSQGNQRLQRTVIDLNQEPPNLSHAQMSKTNARRRSLHRLPETSHVGAAGRKRYHSPEQEKAKGQQLGKNKVRRLMNKRQSVGIVDASGTQTTETSSDSDSSASSSSTTSGGCRDLEASAILTQHLSSPPSKSKSGRILDSHDCCTSSASRVEGEESEEASSSDDNTEQDSPSLSDSDSYTSSRILK